MKKIAFVLIPLCLSALGAFAFSANHTMEVRAEATGPVQGSVGTYGTNISLKDKTSQEIKDYYEPLNSLSAEELQGENLLKNLRSIIHNFTYYSYSDVWRIYEITDREWSLSPAEEDSFSRSGKTTTYDAENQVYTTYVYGQSTSSVQGNNPYVHTLYRQRDQYGVTTEAGRIREWGEHTGTANATNREHVWCQSRGFKAPSEAYGPAGTDVHHLISGDAYVNQKHHNNSPYGFVDRDGAITEYADAPAFDADNLNGTPTSIHALDEATKVFEPQDCDKGDIARACFYMAACYNNISGTETITQYDPQLTLADYATSDGKSEISSETGKPTTMGILSDLLSWHKMDPVDEYEIHRNNLIDINYQHNRNPFIDYPEWVDYIWGTTTFDAEAHKTLTYDPTPTGHVDLSKDVINGYVTPEIDPGEDVELPEGWAKTGRIQAGDTVAFVQENASDDQNHILSGMNAGNYGNHSVVTLTDGALTEDPTYTLTVEAGSQSNSFAFKTDTDQYLAYTAASGNVLNLSGEKNDQSSWGVTITDGIAVIQNIGTSARYLQWNNTEKYFRFSCYQKTQMNFSIYMPIGDQITNWAEDFKTIWTSGCNPNGGYSSLGWDEAKEAFNLLPDSAKNYLRSAAISETSVGLALERYDYIAKKYDGTLQNFINRSWEQSLGVQALAVPRSSTPWIIMASIFATIVVAVALAVPLIRRCAHE